MLVGGILAGNYMFKVNNKTRCEIFSKSTIKTTGVFIVNFQHLSHLVLLLVNFEQVNAGWDRLP